MNTSPKIGQLQEFSVNIKVRLAALWATVTLCYLYCDYFELYQPGKLASMLAGRMGPLGDSTQAVLLAVSVLLSVPALMIFLSISLHARAARLANITAGVLYTLIMLVFLLAPGVWMYYKYFSALESILTATAAWMAFKWPTHAGGHRPT